MLQIKRILHPYPTFLQDHLDVGFYRSFLQIFLEEYMPFLVLRLY